MKGVATYGMLGKNGRLGNCLFQIAATIGYACDNGKMWTFPEWDKAQYFNAFPKERLNLANVLNEKAFHYNELPCVQGNVSLEGYFQSELYFKKWESNVRLQLEFVDSVQKGCKNVIDKYAKPGQSIVSIHFRFGDYIDNPYYVALHETLYYIKAIEKIYGEQEDAGVLPLFFVFSDDKERAEAVMDSLAEHQFHNLNYVIFDPVNEIEDLCLMSMCDKAIIANSSFSWWGAYLGKQKDVIAPCEWFGSVAGHNTKDLIPEGWFKI